MPAQGLSTAERTAASRSAIVRIVRMVFAVLVLTTILLYVLKSDNVGGETGIDRYVIQDWWIPASGAFLLATVVLALDVFTPTKKLSTLSAVFFGLLAGIVATFALGLIVDLIVQSYGIKSSDFVAAVKIMIGICLCYLAISTVLQTQDDFRLVIPYVEFARQIRGPRPMILDSSALIDARVADLADTGLLQTPILIPSAVLTELQALADSADRTKRLRGRRGLDIVNRLQRNPNLDVSIDETPLPQVAVDQQLVELARLLGASLVTTDTGLQRIAEIHNVSIFNLNDVATALRPSLLPGSRVSIRLLRQGEQPHQAVGFLEDGAMVVVDDAAHRVGTDTTIEITSSLQTSAGRLMFARPADAPLPDQPQSSAPADESSNQIPTSPTSPALPTRSPAPATTPPPSRAEPESRPGPFGPGHSRRPGPPRNPRR
jgi:uncharacterized protein YacL